MTVHRSKSREKDRERGRREERREQPAAAAQPKEEEKHGLRLAALKQQEAGGEGGVKPPEKEKEGVNLGLSGALTEVSLLCSELAFY